MKTTLYHPTLPVTQEVAEKDVERFVKSGWRKTQPKPKPGK